MSWCRLKYSHIDSYEILCDVPEPMPGKGIAISYVWGTPPYREHLLKCQTPSGTPEGRRILLGDIWNQQLFLYSIWNATKGEPFWLDQLSLPRDRESRRPLLNQIPDVYKNHSVHVVLGSSRCQHIPKIPPLKDLIDNLELIETSADAFEEHIEQCPSCLRLHPWPTRLWPRQEALYARSMRLIYNEQDFSSKIEEPTNNKFMDIVMNLDELFADKEDAAPTRNPALLNKFRQEKSTAIELFNKAKSFNFIRGEETSFNHDVNFEKTIFRLGRSFRMVTDEKDLVLAVWCDLKGYRIPQNALHMNTKELLLDAASQYYRLTLRRIPVLLTRGLLGLPGSSLEPVLYFPSRTGKLSCSYYQQWRKPGPGLAMSSNGEVSGRVSEEEVDLCSIEDFMRANLTSAQVKESIRSHTTDAELATLIRQLIEQMDLIKQAGEVVARGCEVAFNILAATLVTEDTSREIYGTDDVDIIIDAFEVITLLYVGCPVEFVNQIQDFAWFYREGNVYIPLFCRKTDRSVCFFKADGIGCIFIVETVEGGKWRAVGCAPQIADFDGSIIEAICC